MLVHALDTYWMAARDLEDLLGLVIHDGLKSGGVFLLNIGDLSARGAWHWQRWRHFTYRGIKVDALGLKAALRG